MSCDMSRDMYSHTSCAGAQSETGKMLYKCLLPWLPGVVQGLQEVLLKGSKVSLLAADILHNTIILSIYHSVCIME